MPFQVPMRKYVKYNVIGPLRTEIPGLILRKAAIVQDSELRTGGRIDQRIRFSAIVKAGPIEKSAEPRPFGIEFPAPFNAVEQAVRPLRLAVKRCHPPVLNIIVIHSPGTAACRLLSTYGTALRIVPAMLVDRVLENVVVACHIGFRQWGWAAAGCECHHSGRVETMAILPH